MSRKTVVRTCSSLLPHCFIAGSFASRESRKEPSKKWRTLILTLLRNLNSWAIRSSPSTVGAFSPDYLPQLVFFLLAALSQWVLFYHHHVKDIAETWIKHLESSPLIFGSDHVIDRFSSDTPESGRKITLLYLANDILQLSKKHTKSEEFSSNFSKVLPRALADMRNCDTKQRTSSARLIE